LGKKIIFENKFVMFWRKRSEKSDILRQNGSKNREIGAGKNEKHVFWGGKISICTPPPGREFVSIGKIWKNRGKIGLSSQKSSKIHV